MKDLIHHPLKIMLKLIHIFINNQPYPSHTPHLTPETQKALQEALQASIEEVAKNLSPYVGILVKIANFILSADVVNAPTSPTDFRFSEVTYYCVNKKTKTLNKKNNHIRDHNITDFVCVCLLFVGKFNFDNSGKLCCFNLNA